VRADHLHAIADALAIADGESNGDAYVHNARRFSHLAGIKSALEGILDSVKSDMADLQEPLLEAFLEAGRQRDTILDHTLYLRRDIYANCPKGPDGYVTATLRLREHGLGALVKTAPVPASVRAWVLERVKEAEAAGGSWTTIENLLDLIGLPDDLRAVIQVRVEPKIVAVKA
jgi:hypothetical protein